MEVPNFVKERTKKWNRVLSFAANPCDAPFTIYADSARVAAGKALVTLLSFGLSDVFRGYFRPKNIDARRCMGRRKKRRRGVGLPEIGNEIGKRLPGADIQRARDYGSVGKKIWLIDGIGQRVLFWFMIADVVTDFAYDFVNGIYKEKFCRVDGIGRALADNTIFGYRPWPFSGWFLVNFGQIVYSHEMGGQGLLIFQLATATKGTAAIAWDITIPPGMDGTATVQLYGGDPPQPEEITVPANGGTSFSVTVTSSGTFRNISAPPPIIFHTLGGTATLGALTFIPEGPPEE